MAKNCGSLNAKGVNLAIKNGLTWTDLCEKYSCTKEGLLYRLGQLYKHQGKYRSIISEIDANEKKRKSSKVKKIALAEYEVLEAKEVKTAEETEEAGAGENDVSDCVAWATEAADEIEEIEAVDVVWGAEAADTSEPGQGLDGLRAKKQELSDAIIALETEHKSLTKKHQSQIDSMHDLTKEINETKKKLDECTARYARVMSAARLTENDIESVLYKKQEAQDELEKVCHSIESLSRVSILVYRDGSLEVESNTEFNLGDLCDGHNEVFLGLLNDERLESLRVIDIRTLAKCLTIKQNASRDVDFMFENAELEASFNMVANY